MNLEQRKKLFKLEIEELCRKFKLRIDPSLDYIQSGKLIISIVPSISIEDDSLAYPPIVDKSL